VPTGEGRVPAWMVAVRTAVSTIGTSRKAAGREGKASSREGGGGKGGKRKQAVRVNGGKRKQAVRVNGGAW